MSLLRCLCVVTDVLQVPDPLVEQATALFNLALFALNNHDTLSASDKLENVRRQDQFILLLRQQMNALDA